MDLKRFINVTYDFPTKGVAFKDTSALLYDKDAFKYTIDEMTKIAKTYKPDIILGPEARGFLFGTAIAYALNTGFVMARKKGKLPGKTISASYALEYGDDILYMPEGLIKRNQRVLIVDDLLATGGTISALAKLVKISKAIPVAALTLINLTSIERCKELEGLECVSLIEYEK